MENYLKTKKNHISSIVLTITILFFIQPAATLLGANGSVELSLPDGFTLKTKINATIASNPVLDIKANGSDSSISITSNETLSISISLDAGTIVNTEADYWVVKNTPSGWFYLDLGNVWKNGITFTYQGPLFNFPAFEIGGIQSFTEEGTTVFYFGVDVPMNGTIEDTDTLYYDVISVNVTSANNTNGACSQSNPGVTMKLTDALQTKCYDTKGDEINCPSEGEKFYGQDGNYTRLTSNYNLDCNNTIVVDNNTGLMWETAHHDDRENYSTANSYCEAITLGGYDDWRLPTIKELFSISEWHGSQNETNAFYLDSTIFDFDYPQIDQSDLTGTHSNQMMGQTWSSTIRPDNKTSVYFFNFLDAHIKSQSTTNIGSELFYRCVKGEEGKYENNFVDNNDQSVTDTATELMWQKTNGEQSSGDYQFTWEEGMNYCENLSLAGYDDWRLPDIKELQSIVDYDPPDWLTTRMVLDTTVFEFNLPSGKNLSTPPTTSPPDGSSVAPFFWSSTTHGDSTSFASYVCFGSCWAVEDQGMNYDVHGPGAQRADPKDDQNGNIWNNIGNSIGDQKDVVQVNNFVRCCRN